MFDVKATKVTEFSLLFSGWAGEERDFNAAQRLLRDGRDLYECGRLRHITEHPTTDGQGTFIEADVMNGANEKVRAHVTVRVDGPSRFAVRTEGRAAANGAMAQDAAGAATITGMECTCTRRDVPRCVHVCAVCFRLFYQYRYTSRDACTGRTVIPCEASEIIERYMANRLGTYFPDSADEVTAMARGLEVITGFNEWERWIGNDHTMCLLGNCLPTVEETIDMDTQVWPRLEEPGLMAVLPHGWFTMLEATYEKLCDCEKLAKVYAVYIAQGHLPQDARYVDRLRWLLGDTAELDSLLGELTNGFRPAKDDCMRPVAGLAYEQLLREFRLSDKAVIYCESLRQYDRGCARRLADTISVI